MFWTGKSIDRRVIGGRQELREVEYWVWLLVGMMFLFGMMKIFWKLTQMMFAQFSEYTKNHWVKCLKMVCFMVRDLYLNKK